MRSGWTRNRALVVSAVAYQWFYNGANFVAFKIGGDALQPLLLATIRFAAAAALVLPVALWRLRSRPARLPQLAAAAGLGLTMLVGAQSMSIVGTHLLPAGVASVFGSAAPLFLALFAWSVTREPLRRRQACGVGLGFAGLALMAFFASADGGFSARGAAMTLFASANWAAGSLWARRLPLPDDPIIALATQLAASAAVLAVVASASGIASSADWTGLTAIGWWALAYLVVASTIIGYAVFLAVNADVSPTIANTFNYVSPVVALLLSAALLGERLSLGKIFAAGVALAGVAMMLSGSNAQR